MSHPFIALTDRRDADYLRAHRVMERIGHARLEGLVDVYNALNASSILSENTAYSTRWLQPTEITNARLVKFGVQLQF